ncbi:MAG: AI-2E family transporter [Firmicutes bacterium]|nr:AI-2E family transporter [Bacillota bacterium]MBQ6536450.1 AI-2E family transporter [Bacillota bacterium]
MTGRPLKDRSWYPYAVAACIGVVFFVLLTRLGSVWQGLKTFIGFFTPVILGCVIAYIVNPLAKLYRRLLFSRISKPSRQSFFANLLAFITVILFLVFALMMLIPQLIDSVYTFIENLDGYVESLNSMLEAWGLSSSLDLQKLISSSENLLDTVTTYIRDNIKGILSSSAQAGKSLVNWAIAFMLSIYLLADKERLKAGVGSLLQAVMKPDRYERTVVFLRRCDFILSRYIVFNLLDSLIVGIVNAIFMTILGLPYVGLVSFVVGITNLIPTVGPIIGLVIGGFILVLVKPWYALAFIVFSLVLQLADSYLIKPRLFGDSLGVSGLWILIGIVVGGRMFGIVGILLAIPAVAILDFVYSTYLLPWVKAKRDKRMEMEGENVVQEAEDSPPPEEAE